MSQPTCRTPPGIAFDLHVEISPEDLELIDPAAAIDGVDRQTYLERAAKIGILDARRDAEITVAFAKLDNEPAHKP